MIITIQDDTKIEQFTDCFTARYGTVRLEKVLEPILMLRLSQPMMDSFVLPCFYKSDMFLNPGWMEGHNTRI